MCPVVDLGLAQAGIPQREHTVEPDGINQLQPHQEPQGEPTTLVIDANINPDDGRNWSVPDGARVFLYLDGHVENK